MNNTFIYFIFFISTLVGAQNKKKYNSNAETILHGNYASKILEKVRENRNVNSVSSLESYEYDLYQKYFIDDYLSAYIDSIDRNKNTREELILIGERVTKFKHEKNSGDKKLILADAVSGFKEPFLELFKQADFQEEFPSILSHEYSQYNFRLIDSTWVEDKKNYIFSFTAKKKLFINGKRGKLYIDSATYAVTKYTGVEYNEMYTRTFENLWKPYENIWYTASQSNQIKLRAIDLASFLPRELKVSKKMVGPWIVIENSVKNLRKKENFSKQEFKGYTYELMEDYSKDSFSKLSTYRNYPLTEKEKNTYEFSTLFHIYPIEKKINLSQNLNRGVLPVGKINLNLLSLASYNDYEGFRFQLGGKTNFKFNPHYSWYGYLGYGTKSTDLNGGIGTEFLLNKEVERKINLQIFADVNPFSRSINRYPESLRDIKQELNFIQNSVFYKYRGGKISYQQDFFKKITTNLILGYEEQKSEYEYSYKNFNKSRWFDQFTTELKIKYSPFAEYMLTPKGKITIKDKPVYLYLNYLRAWNLLGSSLEYDKLNLSLDMSINNSWGRSNLFIESGLVFGDTPLWNMFGSFGDAKKGSNIWKRFSSFGYHTFETMIPENFFADRYTAFYLTHNIRNVNLFNLKKIDISFLYKGLVGNLDHTVLHRFKGSFNPPNKYYQEIGVEFNRIIYYFGLGFYYRIGAYNEGNFDNNLFMKLTFTIF